MVGGSYSHQTADEGLGKTRSHNRLEKVGEAGGDENTAYLQSYQVYNSCS